MNRKKIMLILGIIVVMTCLWGCKSENLDIKKIKDLEFTVVEDADLPKELKEIIDEKKNIPFKITYENEEFLYVIVGYGEQPTGGYSITVDNFYLTSNAIYIETNLMGPQKDDIVEGTTYPYVVVKTELMDKNVVFE